MISRIHQFIPALISLSLPFAGSLASAQSYSVIVNFQNKVPQLPSVGVAAAQARDGNYYGTTVEGGTSGLGTVFKITPSGTLTTLYSFDGSVGQYPYGGLSLGPDGSLYGTTNRGGTGGGNNGSVYKITTAGAITTLHTFMNNGDGANSDAAPIVGTDGNFYGTTSGVNVNTTVASSTIYKITSAGAFTTLHTLTSSQGSNIASALVQGTDGALYGTANTGGVHGLGTVFKITTAGAFTVLHSFRNNPDGSGPVERLAQAANGNFYGVTMNGGTGGNGTIYQISPTGTVKILHSFTQPDGVFPETALTLGTDGNLYGTADEGGADNGGTIFKINITGSGFKVLWNFTGTGPQPGSAPQTSLVQATSGLLYGSAAGNGGVFYKFDNNLTANAQLELSGGKIGATIGILGQGFTTATVVKFGGVQATNVTRTATYLTATVPSAALTGPVTATTGSTTLTSPTKFRVLPTITSFSPGSGPTGTIVTIDGTGLTQTTAVAFNGVAAASFTVNSDSKITATVPRTATTGKIRVTTPGGNVTSSTSFTVD